MQISIRPCVLVAPLILVACGNASSTRAAVGAGGASGSSAGHPTIDEAHAVTGGVMPSGGAPGSGGVTGSGGTTSLGGASASSGGTVGTGGADAAGGTTSAGGVAAQVTGGASASVGGAGTGGSAAAASGGHATCATVFYRDADGDGFGDPRSPMTACDALSGYVANADDCMDANANVHPGAGGDSQDRGDGSFDFDCDGKETPTLTTFAACAKIDNSCPPPSQWTMPNQCDYLGMAATAVDGWAPGYPLPKCGQKGQMGAYLTWSQDNGYSCLSGLNQYRQQICR